MKPRRTVIAAMLVLHAAMGPRASAQSEQSPMLQLRADETLDRASAVWVTPHGTQIHICFTAQIEGGPT
jgi:hypothetical protein